MTKMMLFMNLLSLVAPTIWVIVAGAFGFSIGAYGPQLFKRFKYDSNASLSNPSDAKKVSRRNSASRVANSGKSASRSSSGGRGRKRSSS